jgi:hypothetical protein
MKTAKIGASAAARNSLIVREGVRMIPANVKKLLIAEDEVRDAGALLLIVHRKSIYS